MAKIVINTNGYNEKRYGRPWIAKCDEAARVKEFGDWIGSDGSEGELSLEVPDDKVIIIARGQKDHRGSSVTRLAVVQNGELVSLDDDGNCWTCDKMIAIRKLRSLQEVEPEQSLINEKAKLLARLAEIEQRLKVNA